MAEACPDGGRIARLISHPRSAEYMRRAIVLTFYGSSLKISSRRSLRFMTSEARRKVISWTAWHRNLSPLGAVSILVMAATGPNPVPTIGLNPSDDLPDFHTSTLNGITADGNDGLGANAEVSDGSQPPMTFDLSLSESAG